MSRTVSSITREAIYSAETGDAFLILLTIDHANLTAPIRVTSDAVETVSRGTSFISFPFELTLPDDQENSSPRAKMVIDNIDRQIVEAIRSINSAASVLIEIVRAADLDVVEAQFIDFKLTNVSYDAQRVEGDLTIEDFTAEPFPSASFSPSLFPALF